MPRYHFNIHDGHSEIDRDGTELPDIQTARSEALQLAGTIISDAGRRVEFGEDWRVEVTDDSGLVLFRMDFVVVESPAVSKVSGSI